MMRVATAECFTHGFVAREIHAYSMGYPGGYKWSVDVEVALVAGLFIPTLSGIRSILKFEPPEPSATLNDIKVYTEEEDKRVALMMARSVRELTSADLGIGTTAGIGRGGIAVVSEDREEVINSDVEADLRFSGADEILRRQKSGIHRALELFESFLKSD
ncbi:hypothetical protein DNK57_05440 [Methanothermobacter thermautotrophicus]|uniref:UPF0254 protein DNK57_05440 n=1 Tax=Methanothermobacter thermautotrophicus TaxID=145262 RepID=A0A842YLK8_METTF|nr:UPF0254 family protein [Methanothermobacter thermautotrophicus]MBE2900249.1 hypothetical protein [Methanothermobacter thermautotrophicus]MCQ8904485.1 UPF0254 family protein [Methanothermobacter sp.]